MIMTRAVAAVCAPRACAATLPRTILVDSAGTTFRSTGFFGFSWVPSPILRVN